MPNNVANEVTIFCGPDRTSEVAAIIGTANRTVDFEALLPIPLNYWRGHEAQNHVQTLKNMSMAWARENWGTKWNAYGNCTVEIGDDFVRAAFETAWGPPHGWLTALFNKTRARMEYFFLSEGGSATMRGEFTPPQSEDDPMGPRWSEIDASPQDHRRMHKQLWGVEEFADDQ